MSFIKFQTLFLVVLAFYHVKVYAIDFAENSESYINENDDIRYDDRDDTFDVLNESVYDSYEASKADPPTVAPPDGTTTEAPVAPTTQAPKNVPIVQLANCKPEDKQMSLGWKPYGQLNTIKHFRVESSTTFEPDVWTLVKERTESFFDAWLIPGAEQSFRVIEVYKDGTKSAPSKPTEWCTGKPQIPTKNPTDVKVESGTNMALVVSWKPMPQIEHNGEGFFYTVYWKKDSDREWNERVITDWQQGQCVLEGLTYEQWNVRVTAANKLGVSQGYTKTHSGLPGEGRPDQAPEQFKVTGLDEIDINKDEATVTFKWKTLSPKHFNGKTKGYVVSVYSGSASSAKNYRAAYDQNELKVSLSFATTFHATVHAENTKYIGAASNLLSFDIPEGRPDKVVSFEAKSIGSSAMRLKWIKPKNTRGKLIGYDIHYNFLLSTEGDEPQVKTIEDVNAKEVKLIELKPNTAYKFHIAAKTAAGEGKEYVIDKKTKSPQKPVTPTLLYNFINSTDTKNGNVRIFWKPQDCCNSGSQFYVKYHLKNNETWEQSEKTYEESIVIDFGESAQSYEVSVVEVDGPYETECDAVALSRPDETKTATTPPPSESKVLYIVIVVAIIVVVLVVIAIFTKCGLFKKCCSKEVV